MRDLYSKTSSLLPVLVDKSGNKVLRYSVGLVNQTNGDPSGFFSKTKENTLQPHLLYYVYFPFSYSHEGDITRKTDFYGKYLKPVPGHPLANLTYIDKSYFTAIDVQTVENKPIVFSIKPTAKLPDLSKLFVAETVFNIKSNYNYCYSCIQRAPVGYRIISKVELVGLKFVLPVYDTTSDDGVIISIKCRDLSNKITVSRLDYILSNSENNITFFDGAALRNLNNLSIADIVYNIESISPIYKFKEGSICVE
jgi:hypothetical protein